jgi:hypothetical protein
LDPDPDPYWSPTSYSGSGKNEYGSTTLDPGRQKFEYFAKYLRWRSCGHQDDRAHGKGEEEPSGASQEAHSGEEKHEINTSSQRSRNNINRVNLAVAFFV